MTGNSSNLESSPDGFNLNQEISFKENYMFRINQVDHKFSFTEKNGQVALVFFRYSPEDEESQKNKTLILLSEFKNYLTTVNEEGGYHKAIIQLRYIDDNKSPLEINSYVKSDYTKFTNKLDKHLKRI